MSFLFLRCFSFSSTFANTFPTPLEPHWPPPRTLYLSCSLPPQGCSAKTFSYSMCVLSFEIIIFIGKPFLICRRTLYLLFQHSELRKKPLKQCVTESQGEEAGWKCEAKWPLEYLSLPALPLQEYSFYQKNPASVSSTVRLALLRLVQLLDPKPQILQLY